MTRVLVLNAGSSSLKFSLLEAPGTLWVSSGAPDRAEGLAGGVVRWRAPDDASLALTVGSRTITRNHLRDLDHAGALALVLSILGEVEPGWDHGLHAVGHRVVHGGALYTRPTVVTPEVQQELGALTELAPLHNARAVAVIEAAIRALPGVPQVACFDTMFHADLPLEAAIYALPRDLCARFGIRRYGFHGLSCTWAMERLRVLEGGTPERVVICHLGAGSSVTAVRGGRSVDTTMGFTPLEGLFMATRSGSIDPSIPLFLQRHAGMTVDEVEQILERQSGLLGLSGSSGDVQVLESRAAAGDTCAREALSAFAYRVRAAIGAFWAVLGGLDALVLTGGIGEHAASVRKAILAPLAPMDIVIDEVANRKSGEFRLNAPGTSINVWVIPAHEERVIARQAVEAVRTAEKRGERSEK